MESVNNSLSALTSNLTPMACSRNITIALSFLMIIAAIIFGLIVGKKLSFFSPFKRLKSGRRLYNKIKKRR